MKLFTTSEAAEQIGVSRQTVHRWIKNGSAKAHEVGPKPVYVLDSKEIDRLKTTHAEAVK